MSSTYHFDQSIAQSTEAIARINLSSPSLIELKRGSRSKSMTPSSASFSAISASLSMPSQAIGIRSPSDSDHSDSDSPTSSSIHDGNHHQNHESHRSRKRALYDTTKKASIYSAITEHSSNDRVYPSSVTSINHPPPSCLSSSQMETELESSTTTIDKQRMNDESSMTESIKNGVVDDHDEPRDYRRSEHDSRPSSILCHPFTAIMNSHRYIFTAQLHNSLFGAVRLAFDRLSLQQVSIKISAKSCYENSLTRHRIRVMENVKREAFIMRIVQDHPFTHQHPGGKYLAKFVEECEDKYYHYLITEYAPAGDLFSILMTLPDHRLTEKKARVIFGQLSKSIHLLHQFGMAHTDISLENVVLTAEGQVRLIDFGVAAITEGAKVMEHCGSKTKAQIKEYQSTYKQIPSNHSRLKFLIAPGSVKPGKVSYMSPELYSGKSWDAQSNDCFALGVILYSLTTGRPPFEVAGERDGKLDIWFDALYTGKWITYLSQYDTKKYSHIYVYAHLSTECLDLLNKIFTPQEERLTIDEILDHPWMKKSLDD